MAEGRMLYGVTIHDSIKRGDQQELQQLLSEAEKQQGELSQGIRDLQTAIKGGGGHGPIRPLYGVVVHDSIKRGNQDEIKKLLDEARQAQQQQGDLGKAIKDLENALK
jgi:uncharacterized protein YlxW (UPF0749 family)